MKHYYHNKHPGFQFYVFLIILLTLSSSSFANCSLSLFIDSVLSTNPGIKAAESNVQAAAARTNAATYPIYNPEFNAEYQNAIENTRSVGISQTIDWTNKRGAKRNISCADLSIAKAELAVSRQQLVAQTLDALARYHAAKRVAILAKKRSNLLKQFVGITNRRYKNGDISRVEVDLSQLTFSEALAQQAVAETNLNEALQTLRSVSGLSEANWPKLPGKLPQLSFNAITVEAIAAKQPSVEALHQQYVSAIAKIKLAERERYPDPTFGIQGGYQKEEGERKNLIGLTLTIPLYIFNPYRAEVDAANFDAIEAAQKRSVLFMQTRAAILGSAERYHTLYTANQNWRKTTSRSLTDGVTLIAKLWRAGEISTVEYLIQVKQRIDNQIAGAELQGRTWQAWVEWLKVSGQAESWSYRKIC